MTPTLPFLTGYPEPLLAQVRASIADGTLAARLAQHYAQTHTVRSDPALYEYAMELKQRHLRHAPLLSRVAYDGRLQIDQRALGTLTAVSRVQGGQLRAKREIRVAVVFKTAPAEMLKMIVVHELAHLKEREHGKAFYALCEHMLPGYHQVEFDTRLYLTLLAMEMSVAPLVSQGSPGPGGLAAPVAGI